MRRLVVVLLVATLALSITGCGGGEEPAPTTTTGTEPPAAPAAAPGTVVGGATGQIADRSDLSTETFVPFTVEDMPADVQKRLETKQAMLLLFYNSAQLHTDDLRSQVNAVIKANRGNIDLLSYDLSKYTSFDASGYVEVNQDALAEDEKATESVRFARSAAVDHVPFIIIVDDQGYQIFRSRGFIDAELLGRQVQRAAR